MKTSKISKNYRLVLASLAILFAGLLTLPAMAKQQAVQQQKGTEDSFFIISSVDAKKQQIVLKLPTEVTEVVQVTPATTYRDEKGNPLKFEDLRAGDTVYATINRNANGSLSVTSVRRAPMTLEELHRRYLMEE